MLYGSLACRTSKYKLVERTGGYGIGQGYLVPVPRKLLFLCVARASFLLMGTKNSKPARMSTQHTIDATGGDAEVAYFALG